MPEPLKNLFNPNMITLMGNHLKRIDPDFKLEKFITIATKDIDALELKQRSTQIRQALEIALPANYRKACNIMLAALDPATDIDLTQTTMEQAGIRGWAIMPMADFIAVHGLDDIDFSLGMLKAFTKRFSAEFAIREFLLSDPKRTLICLQDWATDPNYHVRRLVSEGTRPRLPWAIGLSMFVKDPAPLIPLLEILKDDPKEYIRRSVANNLNDIAKDHPDLVAKIADKWLKDASKDRQKLVRHACRTLIKQGHKATLQAFGYKAPNLKTHILSIETSRVELGGHLEFSAALTSNSNKNQDLIIDFVVHHMKSNGTTAPKVFKWKTLRLPAHKSISIVKKHPMKPITTRVYYAGQHQLELQINGESFGRVNFELVL